MTIRLMKSLMIHTMLLYAKPSPLNYFHKMQRCPPMALPSPLVHADGNDLPALPLGDDTNLTLPGDEPAISLGYPSATRGTMTPTVGIISNRVIHAGYAGAAGEFGVRPFL